MGLDTWHTTANGTILPGVYLHATMVENLLNNDLKVQPSLFPWFNLLLSFVIAVILLVLMVRKRYLSILLSFMALFGISFGVTYIAWQYNIYISIGYFQIPLISYLFILSMLMFFIDYRNTKQFMEEIKRAKIIVWNGPLGMMMLSSSFMCHPLVEMSRRTRQEICTAGCLSDCESKAGSRNYPKSQCLYGAAFPVPSAGSSMSLERP